jgi:hypothetical protein
MLGRSVITRSQGFSVVFQKVIGVWKCVGEAKKTRWLNLDVGRSNLQEYKNGALNSLRWVRKLATCIPETPFQSLPLPFVIESALPFVESVQSFGASIA